MKALKSLGVARLMEWAAEPRASAESFARLPVAGFLAYGSSPVRIGSLDSQDAHVRPKTTDFQPLLLIPRLNGSLQYRAAAPGATLRRTAKGSGTPQTRAVWAPFERSPMLCTPPRSNGSSSRVFLTTWAPRRKKSSSRACPPRSPRGCSWESDPARWPARDRPRQRRKLAYGGFTGRSSIMDFGEQRKEGWRAAGVSPTPGRSGAKTSSSTWWWCGSSTGSADPTPDILTNAINAGIGGRRGAQPVRAYPRLRGRAAHPSRRAS